VKSKFKKNETGKISRKHNKKYFLLFLLEVLNKPQIFRFVLQPDVLEVSYFLHGKPSSFFTHCHLQCKQEEE